MHWFICLDCVIYPFRLGFVVHSCPEKSDNLLQYLTFLVIFFWRLTLILPRRHLRSSNSQCLNWNTVIFISRLRFNFLSYINLIMIVFFYLRVKFGKLNFSLLYQRIIFILQVTIGYPRKSWKRYNVTSLLINLAIRIIIWNKIVILMREGYNYRWRLNIWAGVSLSRVLL